MQKINCYEYGPWFLTNINEKKIFELFTFCCSPTDKLEWKQFSCKSVGCFKYLFSVKGTSDQSIVDAGTSNIAGLPLLLLVACQEFVFWIWEGDREEKKNEK